MLVMDLDGPNQQLNAEQVVRAIEGFSGPWDGLFANQAEAYYDIFALRHDAWCPDCCLQRIEAAARFPFARKRAARKKYIGDRQFKIPVDHPPIAVRSAFGGLGVYKADAVRNCWYSIKTVGGSKICEHVGLNEAICAKGGSLFILPSLINLAPLEHLRAGSGQPIPASLRL